MRGYTVCVILFNIFLLLLTCHNVVLLERSLPLWRIGAEWGKYYVFVTAGADVCIAPNLLSDWLYYALKEWLNRLPEIKRLFVSSTHMITVSTLVIWSIQFFNCVLNSSICSSNIDTTMHNFINLLTCAALHVTLGIPTCRLSAVLSF